MSATNQFSAAASALAIQTMHTQRNHFIGTNYHIAVTEGVPVVALAE